MTLATQTETRSLSEDVLHFAQEVQRLIDEHPETMDKSPLELMAAVVNGADMYKAMFDKAGKGKSEGVNPEGALMAMAASALQMRRALRQNLSGFLDAIHGPN
jgi:hypothetical protein